MEPLMHLDAHKPRQENVSFLLKKIADLKLDTGEIGTALSLCEEVIVAVRCLAATHPDTAERRLILSVSLEDVAVIKVRCDNRAGALELYSESLILR